MTAPTRRSKPHTSRFSAEDLQQAFGLNVRHRREHFGFTQTALAAAIGKHVVSLNAIEQGRSWVRGETLANLCRQLDCTPAELMTPDFF